MIPTTITGPEFFYSMLCLFFYAFTFLYVLKEKKKEKEEQNGTIPKKKTRSSFKKLILKITCGVITFLGLIYYFTKDIEITWNSWYWLIVIIVLIIALMIIYWEAVKRHSKNVWAKINSKKDETTKTVKVEVKTKSDFSWKNLGIGLAILSGLICLILITVKVQSMQGPFITYSSAVQVDTARPINASLNTWYTLKKGDKLKYRSYEGHVDHFETKLSDAKFKVYSDSKKGLFFTYDNGYIQGNTDRLEAGIIVLEVQSDNLTVKID